LPIRQRYSPALAAAFARSARYEEVGSDDLPIVHRDTHRALHQIAILGVHVPELALGSGPDSGGHVRPVEWNVRRQGKRLFRCYPRDHPIINRKPSIAALS
jgi:hypothetical protein